MYETMSCLPSAVNARHLGLLGKLMGISCMYSPDAEKQWILWPTKLQIQIMSSQQATPTMWVPAWDGCFIMCNSWPVVSTICTNSFQLLKMIASCDVTASDAGLMSTLILVKWWPSGLCLLMYFWLTSPTSTCPMLSMVKPSTEVTSVSEGLCWCETAGHLSLYTSSSLYINTYWVDIVT